jgi:hypothetical protein
MYGWVPPFIHGSHPYCVVCGGLTYASGPNLFEMPAIVYLRVTCKKYVLLIYVMDFSGH